MIYPIRIATKRSGGAERKDHPSMACDSCGVGADTGSRPESRTLRSDGVMTDERGEGSLVKMRQSPEIVFSNDGRNRESV